MALSKNEVGSKANLKRVCESWKTEMVKEKVAFIWTLTNYWDVLSQRGPVLSPVFTTKLRKMANTEFQWQLKVNPLYVKPIVSKPRIGRMEDLDELPEQYMAVYLISLSGSVKACFQISIIDQENIVKLTKKQSSQAQFTSTNSEAGFCDFVQASAVSGYLTSEKTMKLLCEISIVGLRKETVEWNDNRLSGAEKKKDDPRRLERLELLSQQMKSLMDKGDFETVHLRTKTKSFPALKNVLAARSREFEHMFSVKELNAIDIEGFDDSIIRAMLEYCYTGETDSLERNPEELLKISDKFQLSGLQEDCERVIEANLTVENAARILQLTHDHSPKGLKPKVISFINRRMREIKDTEGFDDLIMKHPALVAELYKSLN